MNKDGKSMTCLWGHAFEIMPGSDSSQTEFKPWLYTYGIIFQTKPNQNAQHTYEYLEINNIS